MTTSRIAFCFALAVFTTVSTGCYTRLTTPKEAREWRATYPELEANKTVMLPNARGNLENTFIMTGETYLDLMDRYRLFATDGSSAPGGGEPLRFRPGSIIDIELPNHPEDPINDRRYVIRPEGTIDIGPLVDFPAAGKTSAELREDLARALSPWYRSYPEKNGLPKVNVNLPVFTDSLVGDRTPWGEVQVLSLSGGSGSGSGSGGGGGVRLRGDDTVLSVMSGAYSGGIDWHEIAIRRKIQTNRIHPETG